MAKTGKEVIAVFSILAITLIFIVGLVGFSYSYSSAKVDTSNDYATFMLPEVETASHADEGVLYEEFK